MKRVGRIKTGPGMPPAGQEWLRRRVRIAEKGQMQEMDPEEGNRRKQKKELEKERLQEQGTEPAKKARQDHKQRRQNRWESQDLY